MEQISTQSPPKSPPATKKDALLPSVATLKVVLLFVLRRLAFGGVVLIGIIFLTYLGFGAVQGVDLWTAIQNAVVQSGGYLWRLLQGDLGVTLPGSIAFRVIPVSELISNVVVRTLGLLGTTFTVSIVLGVALGMLAAVWRHSKASLPIVLASMVGISTPSFFAALFLQIAAIQYTRTFGHAIVPVGGFGWDKHLILPVLVLAARPVAQITRMTYVALGEIFSQDYIRTAHSKGLRSDHVFVVHVIRNAAVPVLTTIAISLRFSLSSLPVVEVYFGWGGIGETLLRSIFNLDGDLTIAMFLVLGILFILVNLLLETSYYLIDPRLRKIVESTRRENRQNILEWLQAFIGNVRNWPVNLRLRDRLHSWLKPSESDESPFAALLDEAEPELPEALAERDNSRWRAWRRGLLGNFPLLLGSLIVIGLLILTFYGPRWAPFSPNTTQQIATIDGVITTPPFAPSAVHPWGTDPLGRDMLSLILAGVQQTIVLAFSVVVVRILLGFILGAISGWFKDSWFDRFIMAINQALAVFPTLLLAALLIFGIGIEKGIRTFVLALALVGWGEIMQFVRGEVINIRPKPFIESAVAIGQRTSRLILMHVLPNLAPALVSLAALEVGAVLLLLGELGFLGIFIRGGAGSDFGLFAQVPEWGALLAGVRTWTRSYPWTGFYPTAAFFIAILGFNLFGEGIRRFFDEVGLVLKQLMNRYTFGLAAMAFVAFLWARQSTGELAFYRIQAEAFDGQRAFTTIERLVDPAFEGRALGSSGSLAAAEYIAGQFQNVGLQAAGENFSYLQTDVRRFLRLDHAPVFVISDEGASPVYQSDFSIYPRETQNIGQAEGFVRLVAAGSKDALTGKDFSNDILLLPSTEMFDALEISSCRGLLIVADELSDIKRHFTLAAQPPEENCRRGAPALWVSKRLAERLLAGVGITINELSDQMSGLEVDDVIDVTTDMHVSIAISATVEETPSVNVIGHLPGTNDALDNHMIIVAAQYDSPPAGPGGFYPAANDNASGVAGLLEIVRTMKETGYQPFKTFLFVAYSGEGMADLTTAPAVRHYLEAKLGFAEAFEIDAVVYLRGLAAGQEDTLAIWGQDNTDLAKLVESAIHLTHQETERMGNLPTMNIYAPGTRQPLEDGSIPRIGISRQGWERSARLASDNLTFLQIDDLQSAGQAITLGLMILGR